MKVSDWGNTWPGQFQIEADDGATMLSVGASGKLEISARYTEYFEFGPARDAMTDREIAPEMLAEALRRLGWAVAPPAAAPVAPALTTADLAALLDRAAPGADYLASKLRGESDKTADRAAREATVDPAPSPEATFKRQPNGMLVPTPADNAAALRAGFDSARSATPAEPEKLGEVDARVAQLERAIRWALGEAQDDLGRDFAQCVPNDHKPRAYWWRAHLRALSAPRSAPSAGPSTGKVD